MIRALGRRSSHNEFIKMRYNLSLKQLSEDQLTKLLIKLKNNIDNITELRDATPLIRLFELLEVL